MTDGLLLLLTPTVNFFTLAGPAIGSVTSGTSGLTVSPIAEWIKMRVMIVTSIWRGQVRSYLIRLAWARSSPKSNWKVTSKDMPLAIDDPIVIPPYIRNKTHLWWKKSGKTLTCFSSHLSRMWQCLHKICVCATGGKMTLSCHFMSKLLLHYIFR